MYILGIACYYHDSSACIIKDGKVIAAAEEERFSRKKHDARFPSQAIAFCLAKAGIDASEVDHVAFYEKPLLKFQRIFAQHLQSAPYSFATFRRAMPGWFTEKILIKKAIYDCLEGYKGNIHFVKHHQAHAAASFFPSPFESSAFLTVDGVGEWDTTTFGVGKGNTIDVSHTIEFPHSLGLLYSTITAYLGFSVNNSEYKVMGLSPYGLMDRKQNPYYAKMCKVIDVKEDGSFHLNMKYFSFTSKATMPSQKMCTLFGHPIREGESTLSQHHKDIAAALQMVTEDCMFALLNHVAKVTGEKNIVLGGGVALNSVCNGKILRNSSFENIWIQPAAGDGGNSIGCALFVYHQMLGHSTRVALTNAYLGPEYNDSEIKMFLDAQGVKYSTFSSNKALVTKVAKLLHTNNVVSWFQGRMEWGPRALGSRSILANPQNPDAQELLNSKVKHREKFRPFAPVVPADDAEDYFDCDSPVPEPTDYMLMVYPIKKKWQAKIPSVTHVDGSGRLQTIRRAQNSLYYDLLKEFGKLSGIPILINTSFNIRGEPIVCTPKDAYRCMMGTGIDYLVMGKFLIAREDNPSDMWDSEELAID